MENKLGTALFLAGLSLLMVLSTTQSASAATKTQIDGTFKGCNHNRIYKLTNGKFLVCHTYGYHYAYRPDVVILDNGIALIDDEEYNASMTTGTVIETNVDGEFEGCDFDKKIPLINGLVFECQTYRYDYAYSPEVKIFIVGNIRRTMIDGEEYDGNIYRR